MGLCCQNTKVESAHSPDEANCLKFCHSFSDRLHQRSSKVITNLKVTQSSRVAPGDQPGVIPLTEPCVRAPYTAPGKP